MKTRLAMRPEEATPCGDAAERRYAAARTAGMRSISGSITRSPGSWRDGSPGRRSHPTRYRSPAGCWSWRLPRLARCSPAGRPALAGMVLHMTWHVVDGVDGDHLARLTGRSGPVFASYNVTKCSSTRFSGLIYNPARNFLFSGRQI